MSASIFKTSRLLIGSVLGLSFGQTDASAAWLNVYGTPEDEKTFESITPLSSGGYIIEGRTEGQSEGTYWYARLDSSGKLLWSKSAGTVSVSIDQDQRVTLSQTQEDGEKTINVTGSGLLDLQTGTVTVTSVDKNIEKSLKSGDDSLSEQGSDYIVTGNIKPPLDVNSGIFDFSDAAVAKLDANDQPLWSHVFDFGGGSELLPTIVVLPQGFLMTVKSSEIDLFNLEQKTYLILTKLDTNGNQTAESTKRFLISVTAFYSPQLLSDGGILLVNREESDPGQRQLIKLDSNLNLVWSKQYQLPAGSGSLEFSTPDQKPNGDLEVSAYLTRVDGDATVESHPIRLIIDSRNGNLISQSLIKVRTIDPTFFLPKSDGTFTLVGQVSQTTLRQDYDGLFASFDSSLNANWARVLAGTLEDSISHVFQPSGTGSYVLSGNTQSWGAGKSDAVFGELDASGTVKGCAAIQDVPVQKLDPGITATDASLTLEAVTPVDKGTFPVTVSRTEKQYTLTPTVVDYPLTVTSLCEAADAVPFGTLALTPSILDFGTIKPGGNGTLEVSVLNTGTGVLKISGITDPVAPFSKLSDSCSGTNLAAGASCKLSYRFAPTAEGSASTTLEIGSDDPSNPKVNLTLSGIGGASSPPIQSGPIANPNVGSAAQVVLEGSGFTSRKGRILIGRKKARIVSWTDTSITFNLPKMKAGTYKVKVIGRKAGSATETEITIHAPEVQGLSSQSGSVGSSLTIAGRYFGNAKPKVFLVSGNTRKAARVLPGNSDTEIGITIPRVKAGTYSVLVKNAAGTTSSPPVLSIQ